jgi:hypothetical protein
MPTYVKPQNRFSPLTPSVFVQVDDEGRMIVAPDVNITTEVTVLLDVGITHYIVTHDLTIALGASNSDQFNITPYTWGTIYMPASVLGLVHFDASLDGVTFVPLRVGGAYVSITPLAGVGAYEIPLPVMNASHIRVGTYSDANRSAPTVQIAQKVLTLEVKR